MAMEQRYKRRQKAIKMKEYQKVQQKQQQYVRAKKTEG